MLDNIAGSKDAHPSELHDKLDPDETAVLNDTLNNNTIKYFDQTTSFLDSSDGVLNTSGLSHKSIQSSGDSANGASDSTCDNSLGSAETQPPQPYPRSILNTSNGTTTSADSVPRAIPRHQTKKSVSFDTDDEKIKKFINGDVIVDQKNPFKSACALRREEFFNERPRIVQTKKTSAPIASEEFITTEDVLKESKFVKTYVKNPDKYFERDPTVLAKLRQEILEEQKRSIPIRKSRLAKYSPSSIYAKAQIKLNGSNASFCSHQNKSFDRSRYPDLSQIKVKTGTDLEESLYNPDEVALNAKRFDDRIKNSSFGSQDDLDDIADFTSDSVDLPELTLTSEDEKPQKSFTNTVNSAEFQEFLNKKGLTLSPQSQPKEDQSAYKHIDTTIEMEQKKVKKPSVLQRLFPGRHIFSSKRKTMPKDPLPEPKTIYATLSDEEMHKTPEIKRVVLERQSFHAGQAGGAEIARQLRDQTRKSQMDDGSSSISSALTNAENYLDMNQSSAVTSDASRKNENKENYIEMSVPFYNNSDKISLRKQFVSQKNVSDDEKPRLKSQIARPKSMSGRNSAPLLSRIEKLDHSHRVINSSAVVTPIKQRKEQPLVFQSDSPDVRDGVVVRPRAQRPIIASDESPPPKSIKPPVPLRRTPDRQSLNFTKPVAVEGDSIDGLRRAASMDKSEIKKRSSVKPLIRAKPINLQSIQQQTLPFRKITKRPESGFLETNLDNDVTPKNSVNNLVSNGQLISSTPITSSDQPNFYFHKKPISSSISPISPVPAPKKIDQHNSPSKKLQLDPYSWAKLRELKEKTDRELYSKPLVSHSNEPIEKISKDHIYGRSEEPPLPENIYEKLPRHRNRNSMAARVESANPLVQIQDKAQVHLSPQEQYRQQMLQLQHQYQQQQQKQQQLFFDELNRQKVYQEQQLKAQVQKQRTEDRLEQQRQIQSQQQQHYNPNFVRNTPQRNTIGDIYRSRDLKPVDGKNVDSHGQVRIRNLNAENGLRQMNEPDTNTQTRCQSVLGNMITDQRNSPIPVIMRQKPTGKMSREEIMSRVTDFCRKSMNKTPTKQFQTSSPDDRSAKISPVSYIPSESRIPSSMSSVRSSGKPSPQVPQRVQSLSNQQNYYNSGPESPIYTPVFKRSSVQSSTASDLYENPRQNAVRIDSATRPQTYSETDSVFLPPQSQRAYYIVDSNQITPNQLLNYQIQKPFRESTDTYNSRQSIDSYGRIYQQPTENIYDSLPPPQPASAPIQRTSQIYYPINGTLRRNQIQLNAATGRSTPLILQAIPQQQIYGTSTKQQQRTTAPVNGATPPTAHYPGTIVVLDNVEQMYRPIVPSTKVTPTSRPPRHQPLAVHRNYVKSGKHIVPFDSESASEAEEMQRIFQTSTNGKLIFILVLVS